MTSDRKFFIFLLILVFGNLGWGIFLVATSVPETISLRRGEWVCTDNEPDGCAEWRRFHPHPLPRSAHQ